MSDLKNAMPPPTSGSKSSCPYCQRHFATPDQLTLHIVTRHTRNGKGLPAQSGSAKS